MSDNLDEALSGLRDLLSIETIDTGLYRGAATGDKARRVFGGQAIAQALCAAADTIGPERQAHSLHAYFLRAGDVRKPIIYRVLPDFDGGSFSNRRVVAIQDGRPILNLAASFHIVEEGFSHARAMPAVPGPEDCFDFAAALAHAGQSLPRTLLEKVAPFEIRVPPPSPREQGSDGLPVQFLWFRLARPLGLDATLQRVLLAYVSDFALLTTSVLPHPVTFFSPALQGASLDHALWFHSVPNTDDWLLYAMDSPWSGQARGFARGALFDRSGKLIASTAQEGLIRPVETQD